LRENIKHNVIHFIQGRYISCKIVSCKNYVVRTYQNSKDNYIDMTLFWYWNLYWCVVLCLWFYTEFILALRVVDQVHVLLSFIIILFSCNLVDNNYRRKRCM